MPMLLIPLLAVSLIITLVGLLLSPKPRARSQRPPSYSAMRGRRRDPVDTEPVRARRYRASTEEPALLSLSMAALWGRATGRDIGESLPWKVIIIGLVAIFILGFYSLNLLLPHPASFGPTWFLSQDASAAQQTPGSEPTYNVSQKLVRISQLDPSQYNSTQEYNTWAYSACSAASMTEVINAYGHHYRITDILKVESQLGAITPQLGLLRDSGIAETVAKFGFKTVWGYNRSLAQVIAIANQGEPVIVDFPPSKYPDGHLLVVMGGNSSSVYLADSSIFNRHAISHQQFMQWWGGFSAIVTPK